MSAVHHTHFRSLMRISSDFWWTYFGRVSRRWVGMASGIKPTTTARKQKSANSLIPWIMSGSRVPLAWNGSLWLRPHGEEKKRGVTNYEETCHKLKNTMCCNVFSEAKLWVTCALILLIQFLTHNHSADHWQCPKAGQRAESACPFAVVVFTQLSLISNADLRATIVAVGRGLSHE